jgi:hypothetical protein
MATDTGVSPLLLSRGTAQVWELEGMPRKSALAGRRIRHRLDCRAPTKVPNRNRRVAPSTAWRDPGAVFAVDKGYILSQSIHQTQQWTYRGAEIFCKNSCGG